MAAFTGTLLLYLPTPPSNEKKTNGVSTNNKVLSLVFPLNTNSFAPSPR